MSRKGLSVALLLFSIETHAALGDGDVIDFTPMPGEFCNPESDQKQRALLNQFPKDLGITKLYALYIGLCQLTKDGILSEYNASVEWMLERDKLIGARK